MQNPLDHLPWRRNRHMPFGTAAEYWRLQMQLVHIGLTAHSVITMRLLGMAGLWSLGPGEMTRMIEEKHRAFSKGARAARSAAFRKQSPARISEAATKPIARTARANRKRLARRSPA